MPAWSKKLASVLVLSIISLFDCSFLLILSQLISSPSQNLNKRFCSSSPLLSFTNYGTLEKSVKPRFNFFTSKLRNILAFTLQDVEDKSA